MKYTAWLAWKRRYPRSNPNKMLRRVCRSSVAPAAFSRLASEKVQGEVIAIDLGTTYSRVAVMDGDEPRKTGIDLGKDKMSLQRVREAAEKAKCELSSAMQTEVNLPFISANSEGPQHIQKTLSHMLPPCKQCLKDSELEAKELHEVVLVGGMTRMPKVIEVVKKFFGKQPFRGVNTDQAVAMGEVRNNVETQVHTAEKQLSDWKYVGDAEKANVKTLLQELRAKMDNPNSTKDDVAGPTDKLQKAVMGCGRTEYHRTAAVAEMLELFVPNENGEPQPLTTLVDAMLLPDVQAQLQAVVTSAEATGNVKSEAAMKNATGALAAGFAAVKASARWSRLSAAGVKQAEGLLAQLEKAAVARWSSAMLSHQTAVMDEMSQEITATVAVLNATNFTTMELVEQATTTLEEKVDTLAANLSLTEAQAEKWAAQTRSGTVMPTTAAWKAAFERYVAEYNASVISSETETRVREESQKTVPLYRDVQRFSEEPAGGFFGGLLTLVGAVATLATGGVIGPASLRSAR
jgi:hypothetical protein